MIEHGLLPDFPQNALAELDKVRAPAAVNGKPDGQEHLVRDLRHLLGASIDNDDSRDLDQVTVAEALPGDTVKILVAVSEVDALVKKGGDLTVKTKKLRVFVAHSKGDGDSFIEDVKGKIETTLRNAAISRGVAAEIVCVLGRDGHAERFRRAGSWDAWAWDVIDRMDYVTRDPVYDAIVVTNRLVGAATAKIVERAMSAQRPLLLFCEDGVLRPIRELRVVSNDFRAGWVVIV